MDQDTGDRPSYPFIRELYRKVNKRLNRLFAALRGEQPLGYLFFFLRWFFEFFFVCAQPLDGGRVLVMALATFSGVSGIIAGIFNFGVRLGLGTSKPPRMGHPSLS